MSTISSKFSLEPRSGENSTIDNRERLIDLLALNSEYLRRSGEDANYAARDKLALLIVELQDLYDGVIPPTYKAKKLGHGPRLSSVIWRSRTTVAIAVDYLMKANVRESDALKQVSKIPGIEKLLSGRNPSKTKSPKNWRAILDSKAFPTDLIREQWEESRTFIDNLTGSPSQKRKIFRARAERLIAAVTEEIKQI